MACKEVNLVNDCVGSQISMCTYQVYDISEHLISGTMVHPIIVVRPSVFLDMSILDWIQGGIISLVIDDLAIL